MPASVATKACQEDGGKWEFLADRAWRSPEGLVSPALSGIPMGGDGSSDGPGANPG